MIAVYGFPPGFTWNYAVYLRLALNLDRVRLHRSIDHARGMGAVLNADDLGREWADAMALDPAEVDEIEFQMNKARAESRRRSRQGSGQGVWG